MMESQDPTSRHKCLIYEGHPSEQLPVIVPLLLEGLKEKNRCLYLGDPEMVQMVQGALHQKGVDIAHETSRGSLVFSSDRSHLAGGGFNPEAMIAMLCRLIDQSLHDGFSGLYATGDMRWELGSDKNFERLQEYEARLENVLRDKPLKGICQYHKDTVPLRAIKDALMTHQSFYIGRALNENNLFYIPPELLLNEYPENKDRLAQWMWQQMTRIMHAEEQRDRSLRSLEELNKTLEQRVRERTADLEAFSYSVSHDLRAPLRAIDGFSKILLETNRQRLDEQGREMFDQVLSATSTMSQLIDALLELFHLSNCPMEYGYVDISKQSRILLERLQASEPRRSVSWKVEPGLDAVGDYRLLTAVLTNLISNAWKFTSKVPKAMIEIGLSENREDEGEKVFFVRDNGAGFNTEQKHRLFQAFHRLHSATEYPGSGVGLASVSKILARHGGRIWAESSVGEGATFYFALPNRSLADA